MKKTNTENTGWQKLEQTQPAAAETSNEPLPEAEKENQKETQSAAEENENKKQEKAVPEVSSEQKKQSSRDTMSKRHAGENILPRCRLEAYLSCWQ